MLGDAQRVHTQMFVYTLRVTYVFAELGNFHYVLIRSLMSDVVGHRLLRLLHVGGNIEN